MKTVSSPQKSTRSTSPLSRRFAAALVGTGCAALLGIACGAADNARRVGDAITVSHGGSSGPPADGGTCATLGVLQGAADHCFSTGTSEALTALQTGCALELDFGSGTCAGSLSGATDSFSGTCTGTIGASLTCTSGGLPGVVTCAGTDGGSGCAIAFCTGTACQ